MFLLSEGAKARSVASKLFAKQDDYATRVGGKAASNLSFFLFFGRAKGIAFYKSLFVKKFVKTGTKFVKKFVKNSSVNRGANLHFS